MCITGDNRRTGIVPIRWDGDRVIVIDQRRLPMEYLELALCSVDDVATAINTLAVRGAPLIGITAAYGMALAAQSNPSPQHLNAALNILRNTRPTARDLFTTLSRAQALIDGSVLPGSGSVADGLLSLARSIHQHDLDMSRAMAECAVEAISQHGWALTICNTGALATGGGGTALSVAIHAVQSGLVEGIYACETRPLLQGSRLTMWELEQYGIPSRLLCDNAAASLLSSGEIAVVLTGADRIARNGDFANKVGTQMLAVLARYYGVPFYAVAPETTFDAETATGRDITIEHRGPDEVRRIGTTYTAPIDCAVYNPSFDVTPSQLVTGYITNHGLIETGELGGSSIWN